MKTALLLIDMQTGLLSGDHAVYDADGLVDRLRGLLGRARHLGVPVVYVQDDDVGPLDSEAWQVDPRLAPADGDLRVRKTACDAFHETGLDELLRAREAQHLVVAGCVTELCIDTTVRRATTLAYDVTLISDGHSTPGSEVLGPVATIAHHHKILDGFGAYVQGRPCEIRLRTANEADFSLPEVTS
jgi:nicotinamidase-related amidase